MRERLIPIMTRAGLDFYSRAIYESFMQVSAFQLGTDPKKTWVFPSYRTKSQASSTLFPMSLINGLLLHVFVLTTTNYRLYAYGTMDDLKRCKALSSRQDLTLQGFSEQHVKKEAALGSGGHILGEVKYQGLVPGSNYVETLINQSSVVSDTAPSIVTVRSAGGRTMHVQGEYVGDFSRLSMRFEDHFMKNFVDESEVNRVLQGNREFHFIFTYSTNSLFF